MDTTTRGESVTADVVIAKRNVKDLSCIHIVALKLNERKWHDWKGYDGLSKIIQM